MTLAEALSKPEGTSFYLIEKFEILSQSPPRTAKNSKVYSALSLKAGSKTCSLFLWDEAAIWRIPSDTTSLNGAFSREDFNGTKNLSCKSLTPPDGAYRFEEDEIMGLAGKPSIAEILANGKRGYDWALKVDLPQDVAAQAFSIAAQAKMHGHPDN